MNEKEELRQRVRYESPPYNAAVVLRGGPDTLSLIRSHARRLDRLYTLDGASVLGVSVFIALADLGPTSERTILSQRLHSYPTIYRTSVSRLHAVGFVVLPTFTAPHYTVVLPSLDAATDLAAAFGELVRNPYAER